MPVPDGTIPVAIALLIAGVATFAFFRIGTIAVGGEEEFKPIVSLWFATFALAPGFFLPLEQETGRALAHRRATHDGSAPVVRKVLRLSAILVAVIVIVILAASPLIASNYFDGDWLMVAALIATFVAFAPAHLARGICSGSGRFREYALIMGSDGVIRILLTIALAIVGITTAGIYGFAIAVSPLFAVAYVWRRGALRPFPRYRSTADDPADAHEGLDGYLAVETHELEELEELDPLDEGSPAEWNEVTPNITATLLADDNEGDFVTRFSFGVLLARIPLFLFQAVQAALLPGLSRLAARGELVEFRSGLLRLAYLVIAVGVVGTAGAFILGPFAAEVVYEVDLSGRTLAMLALASSFYMLALALGQAVIALKGHALVALGWGVGVVTFIIVTWLASDELFRRIEIGLLLSSITALLVFAIALRQRLQSGAIPDQGSVIEATAPLE